VAIPKDSKDWTWVLQRACPECGFESASVDRKEVAGLIRDNAAAWRPLLGHPLAASRPSDEVWSALEYACHVRDVFRIYDGRLQRMLTEDDPLYLNWDQDATAIEDDYGRHSPPAVAGELEAAASRLADRFDQVTDDQWERTGRRSDGARFTIDSFARYLVHDPVHHLHDVARGFGGGRAAEPPR
jgi:hypothetical protein